MSTAIAGDLESEAAARVRPVEADLRRYSGEVWRIVEGQHRISTNRLAADAAAQARLEELVDDVKPSLPPEAAHLHFLLAAPFRYWHANGTRFRRGGIKPGIFYASESEATALAETAYWRLRFFAASPEIKLPLGNLPHTAFTVAVRTARALDLTVPPLNENRADWTDAGDYASCQKLGDDARALSTQAIRYESLRDLDGGANIAVMTPNALRGAPNIRTTWHLRVDKDGLTAHPAFPDQAARRFSTFQFEGRQ
ncbi:MAG: RES family NAD+ phosphorylase [Pacificimonas sp.]